MKTVWVLSYHGFLRYGDRDSVSGIVSAHKTQEAAEIAGDKYYAENAKFYAVFYVGVIETELYGE